jgi:RHS repeat-associated protein
VSNGRKGIYYDYIYLGGSIVATREKLGSTGAFTTTYQHTDALGTPVVTTNASKQVIERRKYDPYGAVLNGTHNDAPGYTGHVEDASTGLTYMQQRYYDPQVGRFISVDPVTAYATPGQNFNRYSYANNNPFGYTDPDGRDECPQKENCIRSDNPQGTTGPTAEISAGDAAAVVENQAKFATRVKNDERGGYVAQNSDGTYDAQVKSGAEINKGNNGQTTIRFDMPANGVPVHSHSDRNMDMTTKFKAGSQGDSLQLQGSNPRPFVTINRGRVMVRELINGRLQARMLKGTLRPAELKKVQENLNREQEFIDASNK